MQTIETIARYLLALALAVLGADKFLHFLPSPTPPAEGGQYLSALADAGFVFPTIGVVFMVTALCLLGNRVILGLMLSAPVTVNILQYHFRYDVPGIGPGLALAVLQVLLFAMHPHGIGRLLRSNARPRP